MSFKHWQLSDFFIRKTPSETEEQKVRWKIWWKFNRVNVIKEYQNSSLCFKLISKTFIELLTIALLKFKSGLFFATLSFSWKIQRYIKILPENMINILLSMVSQMTRGYFKGSYFREWRKMVRYAGTNFAFQQNQANSQEKLEFEWLDLTLTL